MTTVMKKLFLVVTMIVLVSNVAFGQIFIDPNTMVEAREFAYRMDAAPTIDGVESEWAEIPWSEIRYNDRDFNGDDITDPMAARDDYRARYKAAWVDGSNKIYFLLETHDDYIYTDDSIRTSHNDNVSIRMDPYDEEIAGEPFDDPEKNSWSMRFQVDNGENSGYEGNENVKPDYQTAVEIYDSEKPVRTVMEVELTLPEDVQLTEYYVMGFYPLFNDNDPEDDTPDSKNTVPMMWSQAFCPLEASDDLKTEQGVLKPDVFWRNDYYWGNLECVNLNVVEVGSGESIQSAVDAAAEGTIIKLAAGIYTENITINYPKVSIVGSSEGTAKIVPEVKEDPIIEIADQDMAYGTRIENIVFGNADADSIEYGVGIGIGSAQAKIINNEFYYMEDPIELTATDSTYAWAAVIEDNYMYNVEGGINIETPHTQIRHNHVEEAPGGYAIDAKGLPKGFAMDIGFNTVFNHRGECAIGYGGSGTFNIHHNFLYRSQTLYGSGDTSGDDGIENQDQGGSSDYIINNTIVGWKSDGIQLGGSSSGTSKYYVRNNLIAYCSSNDYDIRTVDSTDIDYGLSFENGTNKITELGTTYLTDDPLFVDVIEDDYRITTTSPAVDAGETYPYGLKFHYYGDAPDIGAHETGEFEGTAIGNDESIVNHFELKQNYPNPFNPTTNIAFSIPQKELVTLKIYNVLGQEVTTLVNERLSRGTHSYTFDAENLSSGIYIYSIKAGNKVQSRKMMLLK